MITCPKSTLDTDAPRAKATVAACLHYIETVLADPESGVPAPAGMVMEIVQGEGGVIPAPDAWVRGVREITQRIGVPLLVFGAIPFTDAMIVASSSGRRVRKSMTSASIPSAARAVAASKVFHTEPP